MREASFSKAARATPVSAGIGMLCVALWVWSAVAPQSYSSTTHSWELWGPEFATGAWWQPLTSGFMHVGLGHLVANMFVLLFVGREIEKHWGSGWFAAAYLAGLLGSAAAIVRMDYSAPTVGASGALFCLMTLLVGVHLARGLDLRAPIVLVLANLFYGVVTPGISMWGHIGGVITGLLLLLTANSKKISVRWTGVSAVILLSIVLMITRAF